VLIQRSGAANSLLSWRKGLARPLIALSGARGAAPRIERSAYSFLRTRDHSDDEQPVVVEWSDCAHVLQLQQHPTP
jgi:hypothetical protein